MRPSPIIWNKGWFQPKPPRPPLVCDLCSLSVNINDIALSKDGKIEGLVVCPVCIEDAASAKLFGEQTQ